MYSFNYYVPTEILFGEGKISELADKVKPFGSRVLLTYGGGSIKKNGIYEQVMEQLKKNGVEVFELSGIEPNPRLKTVSKGVAICREKNIDFILAVGGGSTIDCSKVIAASANYDGDPWDLVLEPSKIKDALPLGTVLTLAATGSEMNKGAVITNMEKKEKRGTHNILMQPRFSILDPTYTFSLPARQTAAGIADIMSHTFEVYFSDENDGAYLQDRLAEGILKTCIHWGPIALKEPQNYNARANIMWSSSLTISGLLSSGKENSWTVHPIEHVLSAYYDLTHGIGLAILTPAWMEHVYSKHIQKFADYGRNVWNLHDGSDEQIAKKSIEKTYDFFKSLGISMSLEDEGIDPKMIDEMAESAIRVNHGEKVGAFFPLSKEDVAKIYRHAL